MAEASAERALRRPTKPAAAVRTSLAPRSRLSAPDCAAGKRLHALLGQYSADQIKRGLAAPLLFLALALAAKGSVDASPTLWCGSLLLLWGSARLIPLELPLTPTTLAIGVGALALWIVATNQFSNPYNPAAQYHAAFLLGGYLHGRRARAATGTVYGTAVTFGVVLGAWALWQLHAGGEQRPHGPLVTPATFGAIMNFLLLPALVLYATGVRRPALTAALVLLFIGLVASTSRGAWLALAASAVATVFFLSRARLPLPWRRLAVLGASLLLVVVGLWIWRQTTMGS